MSCSSHGVAADFGLIRKAFHAVTDAFKCQVDEPFLSGLWVGVEPLNLKLGSIGSNVYMLAKLVLDLLFQGQDEIDYPRRSKYTCSLCTYAGTAAWMLARHCTEMHGVSLGHDCVSCDRTFYDASRLSRHMLVHK